MNIPREWEAYAEETGNPELPFATIANWEQVLEMSGVPKSQMATVRLIEDPQGDLLGWIYTGKDNVEMVQHKQIFSMQFTYGVEAELERGNGEVVPLRVEKIADLYS